MKTSNSEILPAPPRLFRTLVAGFDTITNHIILILFPIGLDLLLWLGPRLRLRKLITNVIGNLISQSLQVAPDLETTEVLKSVRELWTLAGEHFNLLVALRSYPVGIPSLMTSVLPLEGPLGIPPYVEINSFLHVASVYVLLTFAGLVLGTFYFNSVAQAALSSEIRWRQVTKDWPWLSIQIIQLALTWLALLLAVSIPASCVISLSAFGNMAFGQCAVLLYVGLLIWLIFPLLFSAHGVFVNRQKMWPSIKQGILITRLTLPTTSLFFVCVIVLSQGLNLLWKVTPADSWLMLLSMAGHAFVTTGLLSASFIYYRDADTWIRGQNSQETRSRTVE